MALSSRRVWPRTGVTRATSDAQKQRSASKSHKGVPATSNACRHPTVAPTSDLYSLFLNPRLFNFFVLVARFRPFLVPFVIFVLTPLIYITTSNPITPNPTTLTPTSCTLLNSSLWLHSQTFRPLKSPSAGETPIPLPLRDSHIPQIRNPDHRARQYIPVFRQHKPT